MDQEIADYIIKGDTPILPLENFVDTNAMSSPTSNSNTEIRSNRNKKKQLQRRKFFRKQGLKRIRENRWIVPQTPSVEYIYSNCLEDNTFDRSKHDYYVAKSKEDDSNSMDITEGKTDEELVELNNEQKNKIELLEKDNSQLRAAVYRIKKQLKSVCQM